MRTHRLTLAAVSVLMVATGCGTDDGGAEDGTSGATSRATEVGFPCTAVTDEVLDAVDTALREAGYTSPAGRVAVGLLEGSEHVVGCTIVPDFLYAGVLGFDRQVPLTDHLDAYGGTSPEPVTGLGDEAFAATNSYDGTRLVARSGDRVVLVDSRFAGEAVPREVLETLAEALLAADDDVPPIGLPEECPSIDDEHLAAELDEVVLARGQLREDGSLTCAYASADSHVRLHAVNADEASLMMMQADETGEPEDLDGDPAYVDDDRVSVVVGDRCLVGVLTSPMGWAPADPRSEQQTAAALLDLARWVRDDIGCPD